MAVKTETTHVFGTAPKDPGPDWELIKVLPVKKKVEKFSGSEKEEVTYVL